MAELGMDVDAMQGVAQQLGASADSLQRALQQLDGLVQRLPSSWTGPDAQRFANQVWPPLRRELIAVQQETAALRDTATREIDQQRAASSVSGTGSVVVTLPGGAAPGVDWATLLDRVKTTGENTITAEGLGEELAKLSQGASGIAGHLDGLTKALGGAGLVLGGVDLVQDVANGDLLKGLLDAAPEGVSSADLALGAASTLGPLALGVGAFTGFVEMTTPVTSAQQDDTYAQGVHEMFGPNVDADHLTSEQAQAMSQRYAGPIGVAMMISDTMDSTANKIFPWNWGKK